MVAAGHEVLSRQGNGPDGIFSDDAAEDAAVMYSLLGCCKAADVNFRYWMVYVLSQTKTTTRILLNCFLVITPRETPRNSILTSNVLEVFES